LCGCPSPAVIVFRNQSKSVIYIKPENSKVIMIPSGAEVVIRIELAMDSVVYLDKIQYKFSKKDMMGFKSNELNSFDSKEVGLSTRACIIESNGFIYLARKMNRNGQIILPKNQPGNFPVKMSREMNPRAN
jgi:hypothetical protein